MTHASHMATQPVTDPAAVFAAIAAHATDVDQGCADIGDDLRLMADSGVLADLTAACLPGADWSRGVDLLSQTGAASLSVGRIAEGHANAARLIALYGTPAQQGRYLAHDVLLGVWGADGAPPLRIGDVSADGVILTGTKAFCSGLGLVQAAVVTAPLPDGPQLLIVDATDTARQNAAIWRVSGMRATASGVFDMQDLWAQKLGQPGDQVIEPHFEGGVWRYLALHAGAIGAIAQAAVLHLRAGGATDLQKARLAQLMIAAGTARLWTLHAASSAETIPPRPDAAAQVLLSREAVEVACQQGLSIAERLFGTAAFRTGSRVDLMRRDLAFFLRQADLDGKLMRAADGMLAQMPQVTP